MKILHFIRSIDPARGGPPRSTVSLCEALALTGAQVRLVTTDATGWPAHILCKRQLGTGQMEILVSPGLSYVCEGRRQISWADIVHMQSIWKVEHAFLARHCNALNRPLVLSPRGELDVWSLQQKALKKKVFMTIAGASLIRRSAALHMLNDDEENGFLKRGQQHPTFVVPNGVDPAEWDEPLRDVPVRSRYPEIGDKTIVLFFARLHHKKGGVLLAEAFRDVVADFPDSFLVFAGPDYGERRKLETILQSESLRGRALVLDAQVGEQRRRWLSDSDIVALPSFQEGHPRVILEAAYLQKAILLTRQCNVPELIDAGAAELVQTSVESIAGGLRRLLADPGRRSQFGSRAGKLIRDQFTWAAIAEQMMREYNKLTNEDKRSA